jgi:hypothetical protein
MTKNLYILIIAPDSQIALKKTGSELSIPSKSVDDAELKDLNLNAKLKTWFEAEDGIKDIGFNPSRFKYCRSAKDEDIAKITGALPSDLKGCAILKVTNDEKAKVEKNTNYKFYSTFELNASGDRVLHKHIESLNKDGKDFFTTFQYLTDKTGNPLDKCINSAPSPSTSSITYKFYRPVFPFPLLIRPGLFGPSVVYSSNLPIVTSPFITPAVTPSMSRESSPRFSNIKTKDAPKVPRSPSPVVPRSPRTPSPVVPRSPRSSSQVISRMRRGGYYEKYMKYKLKYLKLKQELN